MRYKEKSLTIEAWQYQGKNPFSPDSDAPTWLKNSNHFLWCVAFLGAPRLLYMTNSDPDTWIYDSDYIIRTIENGVYHYDFLDQMTFEMKYEPIDG